MTKLNGLFQRTVLLAGLTACFALPAGMAPAADAFPSRTVTLVVPFAAGGSTDLIARIIAEKMTEDLGQTVIVENKAGAGGNIGADAVAKADPDGYTILMGTIATHALNPAVMKQMPYDPVKDFAPVSLLVLVPNVLEVNPELPVKSVQELIALLKSKPGEYSYASSGIGTPLHLSGELFKRLAGVDMIHVPYRGAGPALNDVVANQVPIMFDNLPSSTAFIKAGTLRALAVTTKTRSASFPDLPTMEEAGVPGYETYTWNAIFAPAGTPQPVIDRLNAAAVKAVKDPATQPRLAELSATVVGSTPDELAKHVVAELAKWAPIVEASGAADSQ
ncbi:Bug family tripartite tricarboxylate transporter substrate binding protein [Inquilinus sp. YAF38]|uniref:Bug family tripartite tricarboxylate transporter substrate binding protein n=1 Tax=Inquilinus sp. YAF38 TaxID=3233084 RepID=UPI003F8D9B3B